MSAEDDYAALIRKLKRATLSPEQRARLRALMANPTGPGYPGLHTPTPRPRFIPKQRRDH